MLNFLTPQIKDALKNITRGQINEIRLRAGKPVAVCVSGRYSFLAPYGLTNAPSGAVKVTFDELEAMVLKAAEFSLYSVSNQLCGGFLSVGRGVRIGLAGEFISENGRVVALKNITSLNIRIASEVKGCAELLYSLTQKDKLSSLLILSRPGQGKTTMLRDLARLISDNYLNNVMIIDERGEISASDKGCGFDVGKTADVVKFSDKLTAFESAVRSMRPDVIITDELACAADTAAVERAIYAGVTVIASCHLHSIEGIYHKEEFKRIHAAQVFDSYVQLSASEIGQIDFVYDKNFALTYGRS